MTARPCPACGRPLTLIRVLAAPSPDRITCPHCRARLAVAALPAAAVALLAAGLGGALVALALSYYRLALSFSASFLLLLALVAVGELAGSALVVARGTLRVHPDGAPPPRGPRLLRPPVLRALFGSLFLAGLVLVLWVEWLAPRPFDFRAWRAHAARERMVGDLLARYDGLRGMGRIGVETLLGPPDGGDPPFDRPGQTAYGLGSTLRLTVDYDAAQVVTGARVEE